VTLRGRSSLSTAIPGFPRTVDPARPNHIDSHPHHYQVPGKVNENLGWRSSARNLTRPDMRRLVLSLLLAGILTAQLSIQLPVANGQRQYAVALLTPKPDAKYEEGWRVHFSWTVILYDPCPPPGNPNEKVSMWFRYYLGISRSPEYTFTSSSLAGSWTFTADELGDYSWGVWYIQYCEYNGFSMPYGAGESESRTFRVFEQGKAGKIRVESDIKRRPGVSGAGLADKLQQMNDILGQADIEISLPGGAGPGDVPYTIEVVPEGTQVPFTNADGSQTTITFSNRPGGTLGLSWKQFPGDGSVVHQDAGGRDWGHEYAHTTFSDEQNYGHRDDPNNAMYKSSQPSARNFDQAQIAKMRRNTVRMYTTKVEDPLPGPLLRCDSAGDPRGNVVDKATGAPVERFLQVDILRVYACLIDDDMGFTGDGRPDTLEITVWNPALPGIFSQRPNLVYTVYIATDQNELTGISEGQFKGYDFVAEFKAHIGLIEVLPILGKVRILDFRTHPPTEAQPWTETGFVNPSILEVIPAGDKPHELIPMGSLVKIEVPVGLLRLPILNPRVTVRAVAEDSGSPTAINIAEPLTIDASPRPEVTATTTTTTTTAITSTETTTPTMTTTSGTMLETTTSATMTETTPPEATQTTTGEWRIPGFPLESILLGLLVSITAIIVIRHKKRLRKIAAG